MCKIWSTTIWQTAANDAQAEKFENIHLNILQEVHLVFLRECTVWLIRVEKGSFSVCDAFTNANSVSSVALTICQEFSTEALVSEYSQQENANTDIGNHRVSLSFSPCLHCIFCRL